MVAGMQCGDWKEKGIVEVWKKITKNDVIWGGLGGHTIDVSWDGNGDWGV